MYTGVIKTTGQITQVDRYPSGSRIRVEAANPGLDPEDSISVSGVCLTAESVDSDGFDTFLSSETVARTYLADLPSGSGVNIERPLQLEDRFDGHMVKGSVDTVTEVVDIEQLGDDWRFTFAAPEEYQQYLVEKGAVSIDGISLTVSGISDGTFSVAVVPTTYELTTLSEKGIGDSVHFEADVLAKYVERQRDLPSCG
jgi:riboflavin synthase